MAQRKLNILMVAAECLPYAKVGGLADVVGALPKELKKLGIIPSIVMPLYSSINRKTFHILLWQKQVKVLGFKEEYFVDIYKGILPGSKVIAYFIAHPQLLSTQEVYPQGKDKIQKRFAFFTAGVIALLQLLPQIPDMLHLHDWHTGLLPWQLKQQGIKIPALLTIHNLGSQGWWKSTLAESFLENTAELKTRHGQINFLLNALHTVNYINTVSPNYAREILTRQYGEGMETLLKHKQKILQGVLNGIDYEVFNPTTDENLTINFSVTSLHKKKLNKAKLQKKLGLQISDAPLIGVVSRLYPQKGLDWVVQVMSDIVKQGTQFVVLGTGDKKLEHNLKLLAKKYPKCVATIIAYNGKLAQQIYAASDIFLVPSRFEPCGLTQMIAMRYGGVPVVRLTGGLADTVQNYKIKNKRATGTGFTFAKPDAQTLKQTIIRALKLYNNQTQWKQLQRNCMKTDFSWKKSAKEYTAIYKKILSN